MTSSPTTLFLVRHGQTTWNLERRLQGHHDSHLTPKGQEQARKAGKTLASEPITRAFSSPLGRAMETARHIIGDRKIPLTPVDGLKEIGLGPLEGLPISEAMETHPDECRDFWEAPQNFGPDGAERFSQVQARVVAAITELTEAHAGETLLLVSHAMAIKTALAFVLKKQLSELNEIILPENGSIITLKKTRVGLTLLNPDACTRTEDQTPSITC